MEDFKNKIKDMTSAAVGPTLEIVSDVLFDGVASGIVPGVGNVILSYKQNRLERRVENTLQQLIERQEELNNYIMGLTDEIAAQNVKSLYFEMLLDYAINEPQDNKIKYFVNGYINVASIQNPQEDVVRTFYDTLAQMNLLDIRVFKLYIPDHHSDNALAIMEDYKIDLHQYNMIREKLVRLGIIYSVNDEKRDENIDGIVKYLEDLNKAKRNAKLKTTHVSRSESYRLSSYGNRFIKFIMSENINNA